MKKALLAILVVLVYSNALFAQLKPKALEETGDYKDVSTYTTTIRGGSYAIRYIDGTYYLMGATGSNLRGEMASIKLGETKKSAILTLTDLKSLRSKLDKNETIIVDGLNANTTIVNGGYMETVFMTDGVFGHSNCISTLKLQKAIKDIKGFKE